MPNPYEYNHINTHISAASVESHIQSLCGISANMKWCRKRSPQSDSLTPVSLFRVEVSIQNTLPTLRAII